MLCACGCGKPLIPRKRWYRVRFLNGHNGIHKRRPWLSHYGYLLAYTPKYPKGVHLHRLIFQDFNKCCLLPWGQVHHNNGIKTDNRPENLTGMTISSHTRLHHHG